MSGIKNTRLYNVYKNTIKVEEVNNRIMEQDRKIQELTNLVSSLNSSIQELNNKAQVIQNRTNEVLFSEVLRDSTKNTWLDIPLSLYSGAIGYPYAYILFRTLNDIKPKNILETGLGQSTKIITEYVKHFEGVRHDVVEHNRDWIEFFKLGTPLDECQNIHLLENYKRKYKGTELNAYKGFKEEFEGRKFDFISIDGPVGWGQEYSRMDILDIIPECLNEQFVILIDDCERIGEQRTIELLEKKLEKNNIKFNSRCQYSGINLVYICVSPDLEFLCHI